MASCRRWSSHHCARSRSPRWACLKRSWRGSSVASLSMDCRLRSRVAFMVAISSPITFPGDGLTASGASAGPGGSGGSGANTVRSAGHGASVPAAPASLVSLVVSLPVAISATVRWSTISPTDQYFTLGFPVRLALSEPFHFPEDRGTHGLELLPQRLHRLRQTHRGTPSTRVIDVARSIPHGGLTAARARASARAPQWGCWYGGGRGPSTN